MTLIQTTFPGNFGVFSIMKCKLKSVICYFTLTFIYMTKICYYFLRGYLNTLKSMGLSQKWQNWHLKWLEHPPKAQFWRQRCILIYQFVLKLHDATELSGPKPVTDGLNQSENVFCAQMSPKIFFPFQKFQLVKGAKASICVDVSDVRSVKSFKMTIWTQIVEQLKSAISLTD